jgi:hypothetical protein
MTVFAGEVECELTIRYGNNRISTINFILDVERAALQDDVVISETDLPILQQIPEYAAQASADADRAEAWAVGPGTEQEPSATNNAYYWAMQAASVAIVFNNAGSHNAIYRGKNLGTRVTAEQWAVITAGTFDDLYIGDYWVINGKTWRIAAFDYYLHSGDTECTTHHAVIVPDQCLYNAQMNTTNDTTGGYAAVKNRGVLTDAETAIKAAFGTSHILSHRVYLTNAVANGKPSGGAWFDTICDLMNEEMVYGTGIFRPTSDGSTVPANYRVEKSQLPLFAHEPSRIINRANYWLRDVVNAAYFAHVYSNGRAGYSLASNAFDVRPAFCIS